MNQQEYRVTGEIKTTKPMSEKQTQEVAQQLQTFMNQHGITKMDLCLDPFSQGGARITPNITILSTQN